MNQLTLPRLSPIAHAVLCASLGLIPLSASALDSNALPTNGQVVAGSGVIGTSGNTLTVTQTSDRLVTNWSTFNIGSGASVNFVQPGASSVALNRVLSSDASQIMGALNANGQVYLINPSGILFGAGAALSVGGLVASSLNISDANFMAGKNVFDLDSAGGAVINQGTIRASDGGYVAMLGAQVRNEGTIAARLGSVVLGAGQSVTLDFNGDGLINMQVGAGSAGASVFNAGTLQADGGTVLMTAHAGNALMANVVNNEGLIEARTLQQRGGVVVLDGGDSGVTANQGSIDVSGQGAGQAGGSVRMLGQYVGLFDGSRIDASGVAGGGSVLIGGDYQGSSGVFQASATYMDANASIDASAKVDGNGGRVILWSTDSTRFYGDIDAAGAGSGGGGLVETSGHALEAFGSVNLAAASGQGGTWLLDPYNINITSAASANVTGSSPFTSSSNVSSTLNSATLNSSLSEGANVIVQTSAAASGTSGDINVLANVKAVGNATLTLQAHRSILMTNTSITNGAGKSLNVTLSSNYNNTGNGSMSLNNASIATNGGNLTISGGLSTATQYSSTNSSNANASGVSITGGSSLLSGGGSITIRGAVDASAGSSVALSSANATVISGSTLDAGGGNISIVAVQASANGTGDALIVTGGSRIVTSGGGAITLDATNLGSGNATRVYSTNNTIATTGSGDLTIRGNSTSNYGVLLCSTVATSSQNISVGSGTLTVAGNSNGFAGSGRGVVLAAAGNGTVALSASGGGNIVIDGSSSGNYGTLFNSTGTASRINVLTDGNITISGSTSGGSLAALALASTASGAQVNLRSSGGNVALSGISQGSGPGISVAGSGSNGLNTVSTGGAGNLALTAISNGAYGLRFSAGTNNLLVNDGILSITVRAPNGTTIGQSGDVTTIAALGRGAVIRNLGGITSNLLTDTTTAPATASLQTSQVNGGWIPESPATRRMTPMAIEADRVDIDLATQASNTPDSPNTSSNESQENENR